MIGLDNIRRDVYCSHIPTTGEEWQLLARPVTHGEFTEMANLKPGFFQLGLKVKNIHNEKKSIWNQFTVPGPSFITHSFLYFSSCGAILDVWLITSMASVSWSSICHIMKEGNSCTGLLSELCGSSCICYKAITIQHKTVNEF